MPSRRLLVLVAVSGALLAGCSGGGDTITPAGSSANAQVSAADSSAAAASASADAKTQAFDTALDAAGINVTTAVAKAWGDEVCAAGPTVSSGVMALNRGVLSGTGEPFPTGQQENISQLAHQYYCPAG